MLPWEESKIVKCLSKYKNVQATKKDIIDALTEYKSLTYQLEKFVFNDGVVRDLFNLNGTIPVVYKNNTYHIPICIWLMDTHPLNAPMCFVKPTSSMQIKVSMYVDQTGKIYLPYLHDWQPNHSDLLGLIQVMIVTFGDYPPVYSKPKENPTTYPPSMPENHGGTPYPNMPFMPLPNNSYLPYPQTTNMNYPYDPSGVVPPIPGYPGQPSITGNPGGYPAYLRNFPMMPGSESSYPSGLGLLGSRRVSTPLSHLQWLQFVKPNANTNQGTITEEHIKASLISAVEDKMRRRIQERVNQCQAEIDTLNRTKQELTEGRSKIDAIIVRLEREEFELNKNIAVLKDKEDELQKSLDSLENTEGIDVDEAVVTTAPLYRQLLNAYAEEAATEDAIYYLGEALRSGVIDLEVFLKHVRQLSRKQFMLRAIMQKCRQKAGLAG